MERESLREKIPSVAGVVAGLAVWGGIMAGPTRDWADNGFAYERRAIEQLHQQVDDAEAAHVEALHTQVRHEQKLGEACMSMIKPYLDGGVLADTDEGDVVADVLNGDTDACGKTPTDIRSTYRQTLQFQNATKEAYSGIGVAKYNKQRDIDNTHVWWDVKAAAKWGLGAVGSTVAGACVGFVSYAALDTLRREKLRKSKRS